MPNWVNNRTEIFHSDPVMIDRVNKAFAETRLLEEFIPDTSTDDVEKMAWHSFRLNNWGTKWDVNF